MFLIWIPVFIVSFLHLVQRLSPQGSDLPKPFPRSVLAHSATVLSYSMALIITSVELINPGYFTVVCPHPGFAILISFIIIMFQVGHFISLTHLRFIVFYCIYTINVLICSALRLQKYLITYLCTVWIYWEEHSVTCMALHRSSMPPSLTPTAPHEYLHMYY